MSRRLGNRGTVDVQAWVIGLVGFTITYMVWVFITPGLVELRGAANTMDLPSIATSKMDYIQIMYDYGLLINAGVWLLYIIFSSIRSELESRIYG